MNCSAGTGRITSLCCYAAWRPCCRTKRCGARSRQHVRRSASWAIRAGLACGSTSSGAGRSWNQQGDPAATGTAMGRPQPDHRTPQDRLPATNRRVVPWSAPRSVEDGASRAGGARHQLSLRCTPRTSPPTRRRGIGRAAVADCSTGAVVPSVGRSRRGHLPGLAPRARASVCDRVMAPSETDTGTSAPSIGLWTMGTLWVAASAALGLSARCQQDAGGTRVTNTATANGTALIDSLLTHHVATAGSAVTGPGSSNEPVFRPGTYMVAFRDNFDEYTSLADMSDAKAHPQRFQPGPNSPNLQLLISPGRGGSGNAVRCHYVNGNPDRPFFYTRGLPKRTYAPDTATVVIQYWFRISQNGGPGGNPGYAGGKWGEFWIPGGAGRTQVGINWQWGIAGDSTMPPYPLWHMYTAGEAGKLA